MENLACSHTINLSALTQGGRAPLISQSRVNCFDPTFKDQSFSNVVVKNTDSELDIPTYELYVLAKVTYLSVT